MVKKLKKASFDKNLRKINYQFQKTITLQRKNKKGYCVITKLIYQTMKKLVLFAGVLVAVSFASCNSAKSEAPATDEAVEVVETAVEASCCGDSTKCCGDSAKCAADTACCGACADSTKCAE